MFQISKDMISFYDSVYDKYTVETLMSDKKQAAALVLKVFHETVSPATIYAFNAPDFNTRMT